MTQAVQQSGGRGGSQNQLYDILDLILDRGLVIDVFVRVSLVGIELITIDARVVVASVDTYLRFAEAANRLDLNQASSATTLPDLVGDSVESGAKNKTKGALTGAKETFTEAFQEAKEPSSSENRQKQRSSRNRREGSE
ncbi:gas vesicle structural protein GvpA [Allosaccharopolyspora coralli]|uniref:Gas vesicle protein A n=1 Tax=Allosaccharopolyspora coralli TaxID=2665642 RepID=A0A5Q3Q9F8_9PSEU|nr:gas vesicle structural protein GvpA [Allosaccharopolyspora coralli]QGK71331.1 gas vesicle structural protein GvpA [Allosaccharopolyspora coralli]